MAARVLTLTDDPRVGQRVREALGAGAFVLHASPIRDALAAAAGAVPDLVVLDLPPAQAGWRLLHRLRGWSDVPLMLLVNDEAVEDRIQGLDRGADDCLGRSFNPTELRARVRAVLRRCRIAASWLGPTRAGHLSVDPVRGDAQVRGVSLGLRPHEFVLLLVLARNPGEVFSRERLVQLTRGGGGRTVRQESLAVYVSRVRRKLAGSGATIQTVHGVGYRLVTVPPT